MFPWTGNEACGARGIESGRELNEGSVAIREGMSSMPRQFGLGRRSSVLFLDGLLQTVASGWCTRGACAALGTRATTIGCELHGHSALLGCWERCRCYLWTGFHLARFLKQIQIQVRHCFPLLYKHTLFSHDRIKFHCMTKPLLLIFRPVPERPWGFFSIMSVSVEKELSRGLMVYDRVGSMCWLVISVGSFMILCP